MQGISRAEITERAILNRLEQVLSDSFVKAGISPEEVKWVERRWNEFDLTASWPKASPRWNIHAIITRQANSYFVTFEGAAWEDDEETLERRVRFFPGTGGSHFQTILRLILTGNLRQPIEEFDTRMDQLSLFISEIARADLDKESETYPIQPHPRRRRR